MTEVNPFEVLNLDQRLVRQLSDEKLDQLIKGVGRTLLAISHPDQKGDEEHYKRVGEALGYLDRAANPDGFRRWKEKFLKVRRTKGVQREEALNAFIAELEKTRDKVLELMQDVRGSGRFYIDSRGLRLTLVDVVKYIRLMEYNSFDTKKAFVRREVGQDGFVVLPSEGAPVEITDRRLWGTLPRLRLGDHIADIGRLLESSGLRERPSTGYLKTAGGIGRIVTPRRGSVRTESIPYHRVRASELRKYLGEISRELCQDSLLISRDPDGQLFVEGQIVKIEPLTT